MSTLFEGAASAQGIKIIKKESGDNLSELQKDRFISISQKDGIFYYKEGANKVKFDESNLSGVKIVSITNDVFLWNSKPIKSTKVTVKNLKTNKLHVISFSHGTSKWREFARVMFDIQERGSDFSFKLQQTKDFINLVVYEGERRLQWAVELPSPRKVLVNGSMVSDYTEANNVCEHVYEEAAKVFTEQSLVEEMSKEVMQKAVVEKQRRSFTQKAVVETKAEPAQTTVGVNVDEVLEQFGF